MAAEGEEGGDEVGGLGDLERQLGAAVQLAREPLALVPDPLGGEVGDGGGEAEADALGAAAEDAEGALEEAVEAKGGIGREGARGDVDGPDAVDEEGAGGAALVAAAHDVQGAGVHDEGVGVEGAQGERAAAAPVAELDGAPLGDGAAEARDLRVALAVVVVGAGEGELAAGLPQEPLAAAAVQRGADLLGGAAKRLAEDGAAEAGADELLGEEDGEGLGGAEAGDGELRALGVEPPAPLGAVLVHVERKLELLERAEHPVDGAGGDAELVRELGGAAPLGRALERAVEGQKPERGAASSQEPLLPKGAEIERARALRRLEGMSSGSRKSGLRRGRPGGEGRRRRGRRPLEPRPLPTVERAHESNPRLRRRALAGIASHEIAEGATDPNDRSYNLGTTPPLPWTRSVFRSYAPSGHVEVGDLCEGTRLREGDGGYSYQRIWSNAAAADGGDPCVPALPIAYYGLSGEQEWYAGSPGTPLSIPLAGWSSAPTADWLVNPHWVNWTGGFSKLTPSDVSLTTSLGVPVIGSCNDPHPAMNVGASATLRVTVPPAAASGDYVVFSVHSFRWDPTSCNQPDGEDADHQLLVGVYVP